MFKMVSGITKAAVGTLVQTPVAVLADAITCGGLTVGRDQTYTGEAISNVLGNLDQAFTPDSDDAAAKRG